MRRIEDRNASESHRKREKIFAACMVSSYKYLYYNRVLGGKASKANKICGWKRTHMEWNESLFGILFEITHSSSHLPTHQERDQGGQIKSLKKSHRRCWCSRSLWCADYLQAHSFVPSLKNYTENNNSNAWYYQKTREKGPGERLERWLDKNMSCISIVHYNAVSREYTFRNSMR